MPLNYPANPELNQLYVFNGVRWRWNGYAWISAGVCGSNQASTGQGISGDYVSSILGGAGVTVSSITGDVEVSLRLNEPGISDINTSIEHTSPSTISGEIGYARKAAFLQDDGSISFDFIKTYDIFRESEFLFDILSFNIIRDSPFSAQLNPILAGSSNAIFELNPYRAVMTYNQTPTEGDIQIVNANFSEQTGFPDTIDSPGLDFYDMTSVNTIKYKEPTFTGSGTNNDFYRFRVGVTGLNASGTPVYKTKDYLVYFYNNIFYGYTNGTSLTNGSQLNQTPYINPVINPSRQYTFTVNVPQDNVNPNYIYYAYPARLGSAIFTDPSTGQQGGFQSPTILPYTNSNGYMENYAIYRSDQGNLGTVTLVVT